MKKAKELFQMRKAPENVLLFYLSNKFFLERGYKNTNKSKKFKS